ncbi:MAG: DUF4430 domain-containing protein [Clostridia bacterium]|nr:DUF4430 domain-containing protein [Clostridia bacterium]
MKNKLLTVIATVILSVAFTLCSFAVVNTEKSDIADGITDPVCDILKYKLASAGAKDVDGWVTGELSLGAGVSSEWYVLALSQSGYRDFSAYTQALEKYISDREINSAVTRQKYALVLLSAGGDKKLAEELARDTAGKQGIMSLIYGLHLYINGIDAGMDVSQLTEKILELQSGDGGWSLSGKSGDPDVTAMVLESLAILSDRGEKTDDSIARGVEFLASLMLEDCDYKSYGVANAESTAQVICALSSLGIDPMKDLRFIKDGKTLFDGLKKYRIGSGGFSHIEGGEENDTATVQVMLAYISYLRFLGGESPIYLLDLPRGVSSAVELIHTEKTENEETTSAIDTPEEKTEEKISYKVWLCGAVAVIAVIIAVIFLITGKRNKKNFIFVFCIAVISVLLILFTDIKTKDSYYSDVGGTKEVVGQVTVSINCSAANGIVSTEYIPSDGVILGNTVVDICDGDTVYDALITATKKHGIHLESSGGDGMKYISGINYLYEFDCGDLSGWMYYVNGESPSVGCDSYKSSDGDIIEWIYSLDLGRS